MTPQDYDAIARVIRDQRANLSIGDLAYDLACLFQDQDPDFDRSRFLERALGTTTEG